MSTRLRLNIRDLELMPQPLDDTRYELIDGELHVSTQPDWHHQETSTEIAFALRLWDRQWRYGRVFGAPGVILSPEDAVAPDLGWVSRERVSRVVWDDGKLHDAPDLMVEVLSPGARNQQRDLELKLDLYSRYGVREYWIADWRDRTLQVYRRTNAHLARVSTLLAENTLTSPLLPDFAVPVSELFPDPSLTA